MAARADEPDEIPTHEIPIDDHFEDDAWDDDDDRDDLGDDDPGGGAQVAVEFDSDVTVDDDAVVPLLTRGDVELLGRMPWSSNGTYLVRVADEVHHTQAIYKPESGERPLWDFPSGLWRREIATYEMAEHLGWHVVPPTVECDGPLGVGSLQFFVPARFEDHYFTIRELPEHRRSLEQICLLDLVTNNTDRKGGHCLVGLDGRIWAIDHGVSFHQEFKLRTVLWDFAGDPIPTDLAEDLGRILDDDLPHSVARHVDAFERDAVVARTRAVLAGGVFPHDPTGRRYPWPLV
jgi:uncharacterized repeat protein (TIGR03843 family)